MSWIMTFTGKQFFPMAPRAADIDIRDIAHSLSLQCRFNGHCREFYSVAEHSVRVSRILPPRLALWGLLHDAAEAYLSDLPRPVKMQLPAFVEAEDMLLEFLMNHFRLPFPMPAEVKQADDTLLATECRDLICPGVEPWKVNADPLPERIVAVSAARAERDFLDQFESLEKSCAA